MARKKQILALVLAASQLSAWRLASLASRSGIGASCRLAQPVMAGGGFGASRSTPSLSADAARALDDAGGDLDAAQALHYQRALEALASSDPALHARLAESGSPPTDLSPAERSKLVELTWDTIAAFLPTGRAPPAGGAMGAGGAKGRKGRSARGGGAKGGGGKVSVSERRMRRVAAAAAARAGAAVLDVGCGDGSLLPMLRAAGADERAYAGIDLSGGMVAAAAAAHPRATFEHAGLFESRAIESAPAKFDAAVFCGSLQFFSEPSAPLARAVEALSPGGRLVLAHVNGGAFVRDERASNPATVLAHMPTAAELADLAADLRLEIVAPEELAPGGGGADAGVDAALDAFYLAVLRRPPDG